MNQKENKMTTKEKMIIATVTALFMAIGGVLGIIAYYQQWLG